MYEKKLTFYLGKNKILQLWSFILILNNRTLNK